MSEHVNVVEVSPVKSKNPVVVIGLSGPGFIGNTALMFIARTKRMKLRAHIQSHLIPPMMLIIEGKPTHSFRVYGDDKDELLFILTESLIPADSAWPIGIKLMEWL